MKRFVLFVLITVFISSFTLWLIEHQIRYLFFIFQIILTSLLIWIFIYPKSSTKSKLIFLIQNIDLPNRLQISLLNCLFVFLSVTLLIINIFDISTPLSIVFSYFVVSLLPGYIILYLINAFESTSYLEVFVLSYTFSFSLSGILAIIFMPIMTRSNTLKFLCLLTILSLLPILKDLLIKHAIPTSRIKLELSFTELLTLAVVIGFFATIMMSLYPQMSFVPGDMATNFSHALLWGISPGSFMSYYPIFHIYLATLYSVSTPSLVVYQTFLSFTSLSVLLSFHMMAKKYLNEIDYNLSRVATIFWSMFSGFGWIYLLTKKLEQPNTTQMNLLSMAYDKTYADIGYGTSINLWLTDGFIAMTVSFTFFFTFLYLLRCKISKYHLIFLTSILMMTVYFIHISELIMFVLLLFVLELFGQRSNLRLNEMLSSTFFGLTGIIGISFFISGSIYKSPMLFALPFILLILMGLVFFLRILGWKGLNSKSRSQIMKLFSYASMVFLLASLLSWFPSSANFLMKYVGNTFLVPWFFYPVRLGIVGLLGVLGILVIAGKYSENAIAIFPFLFLTALIAGRVVSLINVNLFYTEYWEWRFLFFSFAACSITSTLLLKQIKLNPSRSSIRIGLYSFLISLIVLSGISSTYLTTENRIFETEKSLLDENELNACTFLSSDLMIRTLSPLLTITDRSASVLEFVPSPWVEKRILPIIWSPKYPEIPFTFIYNLRFNPPRIFLHERDFDAIASAKLQDSYIVKNLLPLTREIYANSKIRIYEVPEGVPPLPDGKSVLVFPSKEVSGNDLLASYLLSLGGYNYTTRIDSDPEISNDEILIFPSDSITISDISELGLNYQKKIIIINLDGYGPFSRLFLASKENKVSARALFTPKGEIPLPVDIELSSFIPKEGVQILAYYVGISEKVPLISMQMFSEQVEVLYLNVYPLIRALFSSGHLQEFLQILVNLLDMLELQKFDKASTSWVIKDENPVFVFKEASLKGNISIYTDSLIPSEKLNLSQVCVSVNNDQILLKNVVSLSVKNTRGKIALTSRHLKIDNGRGFYTLINASDPQITVTGDNIRISAYTSNGTYMNFEGLTTARLSINGSFLTHLRNPCIHNVGEALFQKAYAFHSYLEQLRTMGQDLLIKGEVKFNLPLSDEYNIASDFNWKGIVTQDPQTFMWDELKSLKESVHFFYLAIAIFIFYQFVIRSLNYNKVLSLIDKFKQRLLSLLKREYTCGRIC